MFHLLVYPYFSEVNLMIQAIQWAISKREDEVCIHFYGKAGVNFYRFDVPRLINALKDKHCSVDNFTIRKTEFSAITEEKGILDLRRCISNRERFLEHKKNIEDGIIAVIITEDKVPIVADKKYYEMQMRMIQQEQEDLKKRMVLREKELRTQRTKREYDKYYISEETGCLYFNKPIDLERFSISSLML